ncbi:hypothetical protein HK101_004807 [Irineochytrium annulatum]|nr:hypothetical protein HK101_004807 [Irineochytrium annulatum]
MIMTPATSASPDAHAAVAGPVVAVSRPTTAPAASPFPGLPNLRSPVAILLHALRNGARASILGYSIRSGLLLLLRLIRVYSRKMTLADAIRKSFGSEDAVRFVAFFGLFAFLWRGTNSVVTRIRGREGKINGFIAGSVAGLSVLVETKSRRITFAHQLLVRGLQGCYNALKKRGHFSFRHGDSLLFALGTAQVLYAYAIRPSTIPKSYYHFLKSTGPITEDVLTLVRQNVDEGVALSADALAAAVERQHGPPGAVDVARALGEFPSVLPCEIMHPPRPSCNHHASWTFTRVFMKILPVYGSLNVVPMVVLKTRELIKKPGSLAVRAAFNAVRSSIFLAGYVSSYMRLVCVTRDLIKYGALKRDNKYNYWIIGFLSSWSIFLEDKRRRSELAMYVLPRGADALYQSMYNRRWAPDIPYFEVGLFSLAMGLIVSFYQAEPDVLSTVVARLLRRIDLTIEDPGISKEREERRRREKKEGKLVEVGKGDKH